jgi:molecular chaperone GrpE
VVGKPFDPYEEEAVAHEPSVDHPAETVTRVARSGYSLDGRLIRPAQVVVSSGPPETNKQ